MADWFESLTGFAELSYGETQSRLEVSGDKLRSTVNQRAYGSGELRLASLDALRKEGKPLRDELSGTLALRNVTGDVRAMHRDEANAGALFQVASQFNLLEMIGPTVSPEDGVTRYERDRTQGPACAMAAGAATIYRNYFVEVDGEAGQTSERQLDGLEDLGVALGNVDGSLWQMKNGYALPSEEGLVAIDETLAAADEARRDELRSLLRIGVHSNVEVTDLPAEATPQHVSQAFCSALPVRYARLPTQRWARFATLVLEAAYEATLWAGLLNAQRNGSRLVFLTQLGGGAFGNEPAWIHNAIHRAIALFGDTALDVRIVSYRDAPPDLEALVQRETNR